MEGGGGAGILYVGVCWSYDITDVWIPTSLKNPAIQHGDSPMYHLCHCKASYDPPLSTRALISRWHVLTITFASGRGLEN